ncbi:transmembrane protein 200C-like [Plectropomus leopardus]|uniref:transmembrane protein 200C-like n=1 Tax=Plectropomus leopardus TaxID=160734 RepID=UPI001C4DD77D|nr:transmembrane protein 200C-like [Plectropomus leopardus]
MIATGGLLRINARRQDSLRSKTQKAHTHKRKTKKKRRNEVVVVKGKLKLFSVSGLMAALGILVLLVGVVMAALGYWPRDGLFFSARPQEGATMASVSSSGATPPPTDAQGGERGEEPRGGEADDSRGGEEREGGGADGGGDDNGFNSTETSNGTTVQLPQGFLEEFLDRYLYSDRLKVFGPLIMGIGIFLFICANAVLHENRDKKTKVINLRDIYSTVIDLHSLRKPHSSSARCTSANPLNGLVNYVQSKSLEAKPRAYPASLLSRREGGEGGGGGAVSGIRAGGAGGEGGGDGDRGDAVFSIYQEAPDAPPPPSSHRLSLPPSSRPPLLPTCWTSKQKEALSSFTLPRPHPRPSSPRRRHSARAGMGQGRVGGTGGEEEQRSKVGGHRQEEDKVRLPPLLGSSTQRPSAASCSSFSLHREALLLLSSSSLTPSHLSLSSLSHLLSSSSSTPAPSCRRRSLPTGSMAGYSKLTHGEDESFESTEMTSSFHVTTQGGGQRSGEVTSHRKYSNREKLRMISQVDCGLRQEEAGLPISD